MATLPEGMSVRKASAAVVADTLKGVTAGGVGRKLSSESRCSAVFCEVDGAASKCTARPVVADLRGGIVIQHALLAGCGCSFQLFRAYEGSAKGII